MKKLLLTLLLITSYAQAITYTIVATGPHHVVVGHNIFFNISGTVTSGTDESVTPTIAGLPSGVTSNWVNQTKSGGCCGATAPGVAGLNPLELTVPSNTIPGTYPLTITYTTISNVVHTASWNLIVDAVPAALTTQTFPVNTALTGLSTWQSNMTTYAAQYCPSGVPSGPAFEGFPWYYDGTRNYYQIADYTGNSQWLTCARSLDQQYRDYALQTPGTPPMWTGTAGNIPGWHVFAKGLAMGYTRDGQAADKTALVALQTQGYANPNNIAATIDFLLSREMSYGVEANLEAEGIGVARISHFQDDADVLIGIMDQWFQSTPTTYTQPFMVALACEALIQYYDTTADPRVPPLIKLAADQLYSISWDTLTNSFMYYNELNGVGGGPSATYDPQCSNYASFSVTCKGPSPDLNLLIVPIYGWVYQHTGDVSYRTKGDIIFNTGVGSAYLGDGKHFTQNYRWSAKYVTWRQTPTTSIPNSVVISDKSGSAQTNRPFTISRVFAKGDIPNYPQASIAGSLVTTQADVQTRWPDGSVQHALVSFVANLPANGASTVLFVNQLGGNNGSPMTRAQMLAASWGAEIDVANGTIKTANARQIITDWTGLSSDPRVTYRLSGAICTQVILEDKSTALAYDMGWDSFKPLHPIFVVTFYPGTSAGVKVEMILEDMWTTKLEDQTYSLVLKTGSALATTAYTKANYTHVAQTRWRKTFWDGTQPGAINVDFNLPYMIASQAVPNWDLSIGTPSVAGYVTAFNASDRGDLGGHGLWEQNEGNTGGRADIGVFPVWYVDFLYTMDSGMYTMITGMAEVAGYVPLHIKESQTTRFFDSAHTINAFGYPDSIDARPTYSPLCGGCVTGPADAITPVGTTSTGGWNVDLAHTPGMVYVPYLVTGDWYFLTELQLAASQWLTTPNPDCTINYGRCASIGFIPFVLQTRGQAWGLRDIAQAAFMSPDGTPEKAYYTQKLNNNIAAEEGDQNVTNGAFPPVDPTCPSYVPSASGSIWCYGRVSVGSRASNPLHFAGNGDYYAGCGTSEPLLTKVPDPFAVDACDSPWMIGYKLNVMGHIQELGFPIGPLNNAQFKILLHGLQDPAFNPWLMGDYRIPVIRHTTATFFQTWADVLSGYASSFVCGSAGTINLRTYQGWVGNCSNDGTGDNNYGAPGYPHIIKGAASYLAGLGINDGSLLGLNAWNWIVAHVNASGVLGNPQYVLLPRLVQPAQPSTCDLNNDNVVNILDVQLSINSVLGLAACGKGDLDGDGKCTVIDTQRIVNTALGAACKLGP